MSEPSGGVNWSEVTATAGICLAVLAAAMVVTPRVRAMLAERGLTREA